MNALFRTAMMNQTVTSGHQVLNETPAQTALKFEQQYQNQKRYNEKLSSKKVMNRTHIESMNIQSITHSPGEMKD